MAGRHVKKRRRNQRVTTIAKKATQKATAIGAATATATVLTDGFRMISAVASNR